jgi:hypothetical protein
MSFARLSISTDGNIQILADESIARGLAEIMEVIGLDCCAKWAAEMRTSCAISKKRSSLDAQNTEQGK